MSEENIENITKWDNNFAPTFVDHHVLAGINFNGHCLMNNIYIPKKVINIYISYNSMVKKFQHLDIDKKGKYIWILGKWPTQGLFNTTLIAVAIYPINFTQLNKKIIKKSLHDNRSNKSKKLSNKRLCTVFR